MVIKLRAPEDTLTEDMKEAPVTLRPISETKIRYRKQKPGVLTTLLVSKTHLQFEAQIVFSLCIYQSRLDRPLYCIFAATDGPPKALTSLIQVLFAHK